MFSFWQWDQLNFLVDEFFRAMLGGGAFLAIWVRYRFFGWVVVVWRWASYMKFWWVLGGGAREAYVPSRAFPLGVCSIVNGV